MKNYNQSNQAKEEFLKTNTLAIFMKGDSSKCHTKEELCANFHVSDRQIRRNMAEVANYLPIASSSSSKGYRLLEFDENTSIDDLSQMLEDAQHQINENQSRIDNLKARMKPLIALKKEIQKRLQERN